MLHQKCLFSSTSVLVHAATVQRVGGRRLGRARCHMGWVWRGTGRMIGEQKGVEDEGARERIGERG